MISDIDKNSRTILFAGHNLSFIQPLISYLKNSEQYNVIIDLWNNHEGHDEEKSKNLLKKADIIFCEWCLGNAVWYSKHKLAGQKLIIRAHRQEITLNYKNQLNIQNIDKFITIAPYLTNRFLNETDLTEDKICLIYNILEAQKFNLPGAKDREFHIGLIGYVPALKRMDIAIKIFERVWRHNKNMWLHLKGKSPYAYSWLVNRDMELDYYDGVMAGIDNLACKSHIIFEPYGPDVPEFLARMGFILSTSDVEGSHQSVAEGIATGCVPVIRNWSGAESVYPQEYVFAGIDGMIESINSGYKSHDLTNIQKYVAANFADDVVIPQILQLFE